VPEDSFVEVDLIEEDNRRLPMKPLIEKESEEEKYQPKFISTNAVTLTDSVQIVIRFFGEPKQIHDNFDFVHCTNYWLSDNRKLYLKKRALECIITKRLIYVGSRFPVCSVIRTRKFVKKGWYIDAGQFLKMVFQASELDLTNIDTLEDQLTGVDTAFFEPVINWIRKEKEKNDNFKLDNQYLVKVVNRIFG
jgi:hypothetical protein